MKNLLKYFLPILLILTSCSQLIESHEEKTASINSENNSGNISIVLGGENPEARTALPSENADDYKKFTDIVLYYGQYSASKKLASWETYNNIASDEKVINLENGTWYFKLTAKRFGVLFSQTLNNVSVTSGSTTTLNFNAMSVDTNNTGTLGAVSATIGLYYSSVGNKSRIYIAAKIDNGELSKKEYMFLPTNNAGSTYTYTAENVEKGNHLITFYVYENCESQRNTTTWEYEYIGGDLILTLPFYANVIPGYTSTMTEWLSGNSVSADASATSKTITYKANYPDGTAPDDYEQEYFTGSSILDATALDFNYSTGGKRFAYWTTDAAGNGTKYYTGNMPSITEDITLYAQWKKFYNVIYQSNPLRYGNTLWDDSYYVQQYESGDSLKAADGVGFDIKTSNYKFCGWDTKADGTGTRYKPNETPVLTEDTTLYAQWCLYYNETKGTYKISSAREFVALFRAPTSVVDAFSATIYLGSGFTGADITSYTSAKTFSGTFHGSSKTISGITKPLFSTVSGTVSYLTIASSTISGSGAIAQSVTADGKINNCTVASTVNVNGSSSDEFVGGIVGANAGTISNCTMNGKVTATKLGASVGGICGKNEGTVTTPTVNGAAITGENAYRVAGVAGYNISSVAIASATITNTTITGGEYAYANENYVGLSGSSTNTTKTNNTLNGKNNIAVAETSYEVSYKDSDCNLYKNFTIAKRESKLILKVNPTNNGGTGIIYKGNSTDTTKPNKNSTLSSFANAKLYTGFDALEKNTPYSSNVVLLPSESTTYTFRIYNSNTAFGGNVTGTYSIELE